MAQPKSYHETYARFFEQPSREGLRELLKANPGELRSLDFKESWPDSPRFAKHVLALANSGGGCLVLGVAEAEDGALVPVGLASFRDKAKIVDGLGRFLPSYALGLVDVVDFGYDAAEYPTLVGKRFQVVFVDDDPTHIPFLAANDGKGLRKNAVYVRREAMSTEADNEELQTIINRRIGTGHSTQLEIDLKTHLDQLMILYAFINRRQGMAMKFVSFASFAGELNPRYPKEDFEAFILRMIRDKKKLIAADLGVEGSG